MDKCPLVNQFLDFQKNYHMSTQRLRASDAVASPALILCRRTPDQGADKSIRSEVTLRIENLTTLVHAGLQVDVVRTVQFTGLLVFYIGGFRHLVTGLAHAAL